MQGTAKGGRRQGRQRKRWEVNIREWTGLEFAKSQKAGESREKWRKLAVKSFTVPQRPPAVTEYVKVKVNKQTNWDTVLKLVL